MANMIEIRKEKLKEHLAKAIEKNQENVNPAKQEEERNEIEQVV